MQKGEALSDVAVLTLEWVSGILHEVFINWFFSFFCRVGGFKTAFLCIALESVLELTL